jgi:hypothetical protein
MVPRIARLRGFARLEIGGALLNRRLQSGLVFGQRLVCQAFLRHVAARTYGAAGIALFVM